VATAATLAPQARSGGHDDRVVTAWPLQGVRIASVEARSTISRRP
jgi:hypothetical protein